MTKQEILKAIENGESVWVVDLKNKIITENKRHKHFKKLLATQRENRIPFDRIFTTRIQAEHYLHHANITRTEALPFLTWEEFLKKEYVEFFNGGKGFRLYISYINCDHIRISKYNRYNPDGDVIFEALLTEENFYKAYDECVRLFRCEE